MFTCCGWGPTGEPPTKSGFARAVREVGPRITGPRLCPCKKIKNLKKQNQKRKKAWNFMAPERRVSCREYRGRTLLWWTSMHHKLQTTETIMRMLHLHGFGCLLIFQLLLIIIINRTSRETIRRKKKGKRRSSFACS